MDELRKRLLEDIEKTGFPSELKAARVFAENGHTVAQNEHYIDFDENKGREIDLSVILVAASHAGDALYTVVDFLYAEVKRSKSKPWVVFTSEALWTDFTERCIMHGTNFKDRYELTRKDLFASHPAKSKTRIGRTAYQAFRNSENIDPHIWVLGALKAAKYLRRYAAKSTQEQVLQDQTIDRDPANFVVLSLASPLVILDGLLYEAYLDGNNIEVQPMRHIVYSCHYGSHAYVAARHLVDIITLDCLQSYIEERKAWLQRMADFMRDDPKIVPAAKEKREPNIRQRI